MKILQLANKFVYPPKDGGAIGIFNYTKAFSALGCQVTMLAMNTTKHRFKMDELPDEISRLARWIAVDVDNRIKPLNALSCLLQGRSYNIERFISSAYNDRLIELLQQEDFDVIQLEGLYLSPYLETIRSYSSAKVVMRSHNVEHEIWARIAENERGWLKRAYLKILARQLKEYEVRRLNKYDLMTSVTDRDAEILKSLGCKIPIHVCPAPYDETTLKPDRSALEFPSVFFIGALDWIPNTEGLNWFIEKVWPIVHRELPEVKFHIAGRNGEKFKTPAGEQIVRDGEVDNAYSFMNSKGVMVVPLLSGSGIRVKIIEGMALGKTIVTTTLGAEGIPCKDGQNILIADKPEEFAQKIIKCLKERMFYTIIGDNAHQFARRNFSSHEVTSRLLDFFKNTAPAE